MQPQSSVSQDSSTNIGESYIEIKNDKALKLGWAFIKGEKPVFVYSKNVALETLEVPSKQRPELTLTLKKATTRDWIARQDYNSTLSYRSKDGEMVTERENPGGTTQIFTLKLLTKGWNVVDENEKPLPYNLETMKDVLTPKEIQYFLEKALDFNPDWQADDEGEDEEG
jgi:hypothetical protein